MIRFFKQEIVSNPGSRIRNVYDSFVLENGEIEVRVVGQEDWFEYIQSFKDCTDISMILQRVNNGEIDLLNVTNGFYADVTKMPNTLAGMMQMQMDAEKTFEKLPQEYKDKFGNDKNKFFAAAGSEEWFEKLGMIKKVDIKEEVKVDE